MSARPNPLLPSSHVADDHTDPQGCPELDALQDCCRRVIDEAEAAAIVQPTPTHHTPEGIQ